MATFVAPSEKSNALVRKAAQSFKGLQNPTSAPVSERRPYDLNTYMQVCYYDCHQSVATGLARIEMNQGMDESMWFKLK